MYREGTMLQMYAVVNFVLTHAALGDMIASLPAVIRARRENPTMRLVLYIQEGQCKLVKQLLAPYGAFDIRPLDKIKEDQNTPRLQGPIVMNAIKDNTQTRNRIDLVEFGFLSLLDAMPNSALERSYPTLAPLDIIDPPCEGPYVCIAVGATAENREMKPYLLTAIINWCKVNALTPVIVGSSKTHAGVIDSKGIIQPRVVKSHYDSLPDDVRALCVDMREKTHLTGARALLGNAACVVGIDGGLLHLAGTTTVPIVYICTHVRPDHRTIWRAGVKGWRAKYVTPRDLGCAGCQSNWTLVFGHQFTGCAYEDFKCTESINTKDVTDALREMTQCF